MFSVAETRVTPASFKARWMVTSSARLRASRATLWTMQKFVLYFVTYSIVRISSGWSSSGAAGYVTFRGVVNARTATSSAQLPSVEWFSISAVRG